ncbi:MAG: LysR family transcriptional regulator [Labrenzia sp.]
MTNLSHIETFVEAARRHSFADAARHLNLPRSTVTARIKALENELGVALFRRTTRKISMTHEGEHYLRKVEPALTILEEAGEELVSDRAPSGLVRFSIPIDLPREVLANALAGFRADYPEIDLEIHISDRPVDLIGERFDFALRGNKVSSESFVIRKISDNRLVLVGRPEVAAQRHAADILSSGDFIDPTGLLDAKMPGRNQRRPVRTQNLHLVKELVLAFPLLGLLPETMCKAELQSGQLIALQTDIALPDLPLFLVLPSRRFVPKRVRLLTDHLVSVFKTL